METGNIVEYIDRQKIICAMVVEVKNQRLRLLTESNREVKLSLNRLSHRCRERIDANLGREKSVAAIKEIAERRKALIDQIDIQELWEVLSSEQELIDLPTMTEFCFPDTPTADHEAAVIRAFFADRRFFKFASDGFFPFTAEQVEQIAAREQAEARRRYLIDSACDWLKTGSPPTDPQNRVDLSDIVDILKSYYIFGKESAQADVAKQMVAHAAIGGPDKLFDIFVNHGIFSPHENIDLLKFETPVLFSDRLQAEADHLVASGNLDGLSRRDLTDLSIMTIDGQSTLDFDDALSLQRLDDHRVRVGVHIVDVGHFISPDSLLDKQALLRASSIYMPDQKIPMLPPNLAEGLCSLIAGRRRPAISILIDLDDQAQVLDFEICASIIRVKDQLSYYDVNQMVADNSDIAALYDIAAKFRQYRLKQGAVQLSLPDVNIWITETGEINVNRINRESPSRMLVSELMILANWLMARFLRDRGLPSIFRSQPEPRERLFTGENGTLYQNWMQRRLLSRFSLASDPEPHSGLGVDAYVTATSPIRKYFDLVTQRQIRAALGLEQPYSAEQISGIIHMVSEPMRQVTLLQRGRNRYWLLKYLETRIGQQEEAIVLTKRRHSYQVLLVEYMLECDLAGSNSLDLKPESVVRVTIQHADARRDLFTVFLN